MQPPKNIYKTSTIDYLSKKLHINIDQAEEFPQCFHEVVKANIAFITKLEKFTQFIDCLSADRCFALWIQETEEVIQKSEDCLQYFTYRSMTDEQLIAEYWELAERMMDLAGRVYEGHWKYGLSEEADQQFDDLTELCRRIWAKESKAWVNLARVWKKL